MKPVTRVLVLIISLFSFLNSSANPPVKDKFVVVSDAGHGGKDPGKNAAGYNEKDIALKIVLAVGKELEKDPNIKVVYTRKTDVFIELVERGRIANKANADLFVSVHCNAHSSSASGTETYVLGLHGNKRNFEVAKSENEVIYLEDNYETNYAGFDINSPESTISLTLLQEEYLDQSIQLAKYIQDNFTNELKRKNRGVKQAAFVVLHQTFMPSVLIETGFITNSSERNFLKSTAGQTKIANSIVEAIKDYKNGIEENQGDIFSSPPLPTSPSKDLVQGSKDIIFRVQIAASKNNLELKAQNFSGLSPVFKEKTGSVYKYQYGETSSYDEAQKLLQKAKSKGFKDAYLVAYKNGEKISVSEAAKSILN
ncbi:N-acetylmuramoyl-L-alanine amidase [Pustulibacterium marinum]|uniref:N-acetylmuramoyl-L-alanine amidase n=1 Tax=Pustulibacterium marinum TaxID=1224947 RepID=A0A1I7HWV7_9FLAO|nr:N-acetylmuramoyl-L-alanine amidase [Pustulibacterium marinum]SFU65212.1 N-acetylmuramoyl-L-alanine amidase [Pustulibacterium marinum]